MFLMENELELMMIADSFYIPKEGSPNGEDAHFFSQNAQVIGIADGVGGWALRGIDAGEYARELMRNAADCVRDSLPAAVDPKSVLAAAYAKTAAAGSSTACILSLAGNRVRAANVGDSGFVVIRGGKTVYRSPAQCRKFNTPYQLRLKSRGPEQAAEMAVDVETGDVVVAATDGLFDNLFPEEVEAVVERCIRDGMIPGLMARELAVAARAVSVMPDVVSPFAVAAKEAGVGHVGGKVDDITVVAAYVMSAEFTTY